MKKFIGIFMTFSMVLLILAGCGNGNSQSSTPTSDGNGSSATVSSDSTSGDDSAPATGGKSSITLMASQNWLKDVDRELFKAFEDETGIEVKLLVTPDNGYDTLLGTTLAGGSNTIDIFMYSAGTPMVTIGVPEVALDLGDQEWVSRLEEWAVIANSYNGNLYGFSTWGVDYEGVLYNETYFKENNLEVPTTWDEFLSLCDQILDLGITPLYEGINGVWHTQSWVYGLTPVIAAEKPDYIEFLNSSADNKWSDIPAMRNGLEQIESLLKNKQYYTNDGQAEDWFGSYPALQNREVAMMFSYSAYAAELAENGSTDTFGMFPVPLLDNTVGVSNGGGISKYINKNSDAIEESKALLEFLARPENLETYYGARKDLVTASFKDVQSVSSTTATTDMLARTTDVPEVMMMKDVLYWDPDMYQYLQGFAIGTTSVDKFLENIDDFRAIMFETEAG